MKKYFLVLICIACIGILAAQKQKIKVATVGNSLTGATNDFGFYGFFIE